MKIFRPLALLLLAAAIAAAAAPPSSFTGVVGDTMCGLKHTMGDNPVDCTRMCTDGVNGYALIVGTKVYALVGVTKPEAAVLHKYAGKRVVVEGELQGKNLTVRAVAAK